jgi:hypothetical protein
MPFVLRQVDLFEDAASLAYKLWPDLLEAEKVTYVDGGLDRCALAGTKQRRIVIF